MSNKSNTILRDVSALIGGTLVLFGLITVIFMIISSGSLSSKKYGYIGGVAAILTGMLIARLVDKNPFKAFAHAIDHLFTWI